MVSARDRDVIQELLRHYGIPFCTRGKGANGMIGKMLYILKADTLLLQKAIRFKPDLFLSFASPYAAHVAWLMRKPHIVLDDTESAWLNHCLYLPFSTTPLNPASFKKDFGHKQIRFDSFMELAYLHPRYFTPSASVRANLGIAQDQKYCILRFVAWSANHDVGQRGISLEAKVKLVELLSSHMKVFISSESELPDSLKPYQINIPSDKLHDALAFASLYIGEGATTASECAMLGTPAIYINSLSAGTLEDQHQMGLIYNLRDTATLFDTIRQITTDEEMANDIRSRRQKMLAEKIDITAFLVWFVESYPQSAQTLKANPEYQYNFLHS